ncbi:unnamed protein product [marine sediment metagenome]|uniref:Uncharacterized protein n=1 Tax=marine sediment metagenome TaxID=412755 RepID=X1E4R9_9ZZZZ
MPDKNAELTKLEQGILDYLDGKEKANYLQMARKLGEIPGNVLPALTILRDKGKVRHVTGTQWAIQSPRNRKEHHAERERKYKRTCSINPTIPKAIRPD